MMSKNVFLMLALCLFFFDLNTLGVSAFAAGDPVRVIAGGPGVAAVLNNIKAEFKAKTGLEFEVSINPVDIAFSALVNDLADGLCTLDPEDTAKMAEKRGTPKQDLNDFHRLKISQVKIRLGVHPSNPVKQMTNEQIAEILSGKIKNWKSITQIDKPLKLVVAKNYVGTLKYLKKHYLKGADADGVNFVVNNEGVLRSLERDPGALGFFNTDETLPSFKPKFLPTDAVIESYFLIKKTARPDVQKLYGFLKEKGLLEGQ